jgi:hypothetical protein
MDSSKAFRYSLAIDDKSLFSASNGTNSAQVKGFGTAVLFFHYSS